MRTLIERPIDVRVFSSELIAILKSDLSMVKKAKAFEDKISESNQDLKLLLELFDVPDLSRFQRIWTKIEVEAEREHAKECDVCEGDLRDQKDQFKEEVGQVLRELKKVIKLDIPNSSDRFVANYSKKTSAFSVVVEVRLSGVSVNSSYSDLTKLIENKIKKISIDQTTRNFLYCVVGVLPEKYKEYNLVI